MSLHDFFALQLPTQPEREALLTIEMNMRGVSSREKLEECILWIHEKEPMTASWDWAVSLLEATRSYCIPKRPEDYYTNPLGRFLAEQLRKATGGLLIHIGLRRCKLPLDVWTPEELAQPHMRWITLLAQRVEALKSAGYSAVDSLAVVHPLDGLTDEQAEALRKTWLEQDAGHISFRDAIDMYLKSCSHFEDTDCLHLTSEFTKTIKEYVFANKQYSQSDLEYFLCSRYSVHYHHEAAVAAVIRAEKELLVTN